MDMDGKPGTAVPSGAATTVVSNGGESGGDEHQVVHPLMTQPGAPLFWNTSTAQQQQIGSGRAAPYQPNTNMWGTAATTPSNTNASPWIDLSPRPQGLSGNELHSSQSLQQLWTPRTMDAVLGPNHHPHHHKDGLGANNNNNNSSTASLWGALFGSNGGAGRPSDASTASALLPPPAPHDMFPLSGSFVGFPLPPMISSSSPRHAMARHPYSGGGTNNNNNSVSMLDSSSSSMPPRSLNISAGSFVGLPLNPSSSSHTTTPTGASSLAALAEVAIDMRGNAFTSSFSMNSSTAAASAAAAAAAASADGGATPNSDSSANKRRRAEQPLIPLDTLKSRKSAEAGKRKALSMSSGSGGGGGEVPKNKRVPTAKTSLFRGVSRCGKDQKFQARIRLGQTVVYLGRFKTEMEAAFRYDDAVRHYGSEERHLWADSTNFREMSPEQRTDLLNDFMETGTISSNFHQFLQPNTLKKLRAMEE